MSKRRKVEPVRLNLGPNCPEGFRDVKTVSGTGVVDELRLAHHLNSIPGKERGKFMEEVWRALKPGGKCTVIVPYWSSMRATADFAGEWPPCSEMSFLYFNKKWRDDNKVHSELKCDFDFTYGYTPDPEVAARMPDVQAFWLKHYTNTALDLQVTLIKR